MNSPNLRALAVDSSKVRAGSIANSNLANLSVANANLRPSIVDSVIILDGGGALADQAPYARSWPFQRIVDPGANGPFIIEHRSAGRRIKSPMLKRSKCTLIEVSP